MSAGNNMIKYTSLMDNVAAKDKKNPLLFAYYFRPKTTKMYTRVTKNDT